MRAAIDAQTAMFRTFFMPPKANKEAISTMRAAIVSPYGRTRRSSRDYSKAVRSDPVLVSGEDGEVIMSGLAKVKPEIKTFLSDYGTSLVKR